MLDRIAYQGITFDDVLLEPGYSEFLPREADTRTHLTTKIALNLPDPLISMDTVTDAELAIALRRRGDWGLSTRTCRSRSKRARSTRPSDRKTESSLIRSHFPPTPPSVRLETS